MRSVSQSLNLFTTAIGSFLIIPIVYLVNVNPNNQWLPTNLDEGHVEYYFLVLAIIMLIDMVYFYFISLKYEYLTTAQLTFGVRNVSEGSDGSSQTALMDDTSYHNITHAQHFKSHGGSASNTGMSLDTHSILHES